MGTWDRHALTECKDPGGGAARKERCPARGCKEVLTASGSVRCPTCNRRVCLKHRFEDTHDCTGVPAVSSAARPAARPVAVPRPVVAKATAVAPQVPGAQWHCARCTLLNPARTS